MHIYLVRHGQSHVNLSDLTAEHRDEPLTELGLAQARAVATWLADQVRPTELISSTVTRAKQTAEAISAATGLPVRLEPRIREVGTVRPDGTAIPDELLEPYLPQMWGTLRPYEPVTQTGESWMQVRARVGAFLESLMAAQAEPSVESPDDDADRVVVVVCHAGVIEAFFEYIFQRGPWSVVVVETSNAGVCHLEYLPRPNRPAWSLHFHNRVAHLPGDLVS